RSKRLIPRSLSLKCACPGSLALWCGMLLPQLFLTHVVEFLWHARRVSAFLGGLIEPIFRSPAAVFGVDSLSTRQSSSLVLRCAPPLGPQADHEFLGAPVRFSFWKN